MSSLKRSLCGVLVGVCLAVALPASAQDAATTTRVLDPYNPTDAAWLRNYGGVLAPVQQLAKLDPYNPTHAALIRQMNGAVPLWTQDVFFVDATAVSFNDRGIADSSYLSEGLEYTGPTFAETLARPQSNDGLWVRYDGRIWISNGAAVPFQAAAFTRAGEHAGVPVYTRASDGARIIYLPMLRNFVAPFREKP